MWRQAKMTQQMNESYILFIIGEKKKEISLDTVLAGKAENSVNPLFLLVLYSCRKGKR